MTWETVLVSAIVSALVSLLVGPVRARLEEAAKRDLQIRRKLQAQLNELLLILDREIHNRGRLKNSQSVTQISDGLDVALDYQVWKLLRLSDDPNLDPYRRRLLQEQIQRITPEQFDYLRSLDQPPCAPRSLDDPELKRRGWLALRGGSERGRDLVAEVLDRNRPTDEKIVKELRDQLRDSLGPILEKSWIGLRVWMCSRRRGKRK